MILMQTFVKVRVPLCRTHNLKQLRAFTLRTLWQGWWGYISFFVNVFVVLANLVYVVLALRMPRPGGPVPLDQVPAGWGSAQPREALPIADTTTNQARPNSTFS